FNGSHGPELASNRTIACGQRHHRGSPHYEQLAINDRLGRVRMFVADFKPEDVSRQIKSTDLAAPVIEYLVGARAAAKDLVQIFGSLVLGVDLGVPCKGHNRAYHLDLADQRVRPDRWRNLRDAGRRLLGYTAFDHRLAEHGYGPR